MADTPTTQAISEPEKRPNRFVNTFALIVTLLSAAILLTLLAMAWKNISNGATPKGGDSSFDNIKTLFNILLPVIGTWMGTMLAFYFSKDNFEAANNQAKELAMINTGSGSQQASVGDVMIKPNDSSLLLADGENDFKGRTLAELIQKMEESHSDRLPILDKQTLKFIFLIYRSTIERFIVGAANGSVKVNGQPVNSPDIPNLKMNDMYASDFDLFKKILDQKGCFLPLTATMDKVKQAMEDNTICQDVFITQTGNINEKVEGWITNIMVIEKSALFKKVI